MEYLERRLDHTSIFDGIVKVLLEENIHQSEVIEELKTLQAL